MMHLRNFNASRNAGYVAAVSALALIIRAARRNPSRGWNEPPTEQRQLSARLFRIPENDLLQAGWGDAIVREGFVLSARKNP